MPKKKVSIVIPCYNEQATIGSLLDAIAAQTYPTEDIEVIIADGGSTDGTREAIEASAEKHPHLRLELIDNPARVIPAALNRASALARGEIIVRLDAHAKPEVDYVERCVEALNRTGAANVGGIWNIQSRSGGWIANSIAHAASHPLGAGDARYRIGGAEGEVETVPFGAFDREWMKRAGSYNEDLLTNEDYEYNVRIREAGGVVWFDPTIKATYYSRTNLWELIRQYARYGYWKAIMVLKYPRSLRWRQVLPPLLVAGLFVLGLSSIFWKPALALLAMALAAYVGITFLAGFWEAYKERSPALAVGFPLALWAMQLSWGMAFLIGIMAGKLDKTPTEGQ